MHVKDPQLSVVRVGHRFLLAGFCLSLYGLRVLNREVNMIQTNKQTKTKRLSLKKKKKKEELSTLVRCVVVLLLTFPYNTT